MNGEGDAGHVRIEPFGGFLRAPEILAQVDCVFFAASSTQSFESETQRAAFRERWLGRYLDHPGDPAFLAVARSPDGADVVAGYIVGSVEDPALSPRFADLGYFRDFGALTARFPAQLHVNLAVDWRGLGLGRRLVEAFAAEVRRRGAPGVHAITTRDMPNVRFYEACGLSEAGAQMWNGRELVLLGRRL